MKFAPYYYVYNRLKSGPKRRHSSFEEAKKEAERLAVQEAPAYIEILKCVAVSRSAIAETIEASEELEEKPYYGGLCQECGDELYHNYTMGWQCSRCDG